MYQRSIIAAVVLSLMCAILFPFGVRIEAAAVPKVQILEITDVAKASTLTLDTTKYEVTTMPMKSFVASRASLDGKYDAIYIAAGSYSTQLPQLDPDPFSFYPNWQQLSDRTYQNQTQSRMNDITNLKANEIRQMFINKRLPVIVHDSVLWQTCNGWQMNDNMCVLKTFFQHYVLFPRSNVIFIPSAAYFPNISKMRPHFSVLEQPISYEDSATRSHVYKPGDELPFSFSLQNGNESSSVVNLYIDTNFNSSFEPSEKLVSYPLSAVKVGDNQYKFMYKIPRGFSGVRMWKLEVADGRDLKHYEAGTYRFRDEMVNIRVLQVTADTNYTGSLLKTLNTIITDQTNVIQTEDYKITIDVTDMLSFNNPNSSPNYTSLASSKYNMIIFGFQDTYGSLTHGKMTDSAKLAIRKFVETGQGIFVTHDTLFRTGSSTNLDVTNNWFTTLMEYSGQTYPIKAAYDYTWAPMSKRVQYPGQYFAETNIGYRAYAPTKQVKRVNKGLMTSFPYVLGENAAVATTHSQYFMLNLEDPEVIPWYNLRADDTYGTERDSNDSYNHFYIYSRKNVTYTGAGHTSSSFAPEEQKLFVNTMFTSFAGANHAPLITMYAPGEGDRILTTQKVNVSYKIEDLDARDTSVKTAIYFNDKLVYQNDTLANGATINQSLAHGMTSAGPLVIRIEVSDVSGAKTVKTIQVAVEKPISNVHVTRELVTPAVLPVQTAAEVNYTIKPVSVQSLRPFVLSQAFLDKLTGGAEVSVSYGAFTAPDVGFLTFTDSIDYDVQNGLAGAVSYDDFTSLRWVSGDTSTYMTSLRNYLNATGGFEAIMPVVQSLSQPDLRSFAKVQLRPIDAATMGITFIRLAEDEFKTIENSRFQEVFPPNMDVNIPAEFSGILTKSGSTETGIEISGTFGNIEANATASYPVSDIHFRLQLVPIKPGQYTLNNSAFLYTDATVEKSLTFEQLNMTAQNELLSVDAQDVLALNIYSLPQSILLTYNPETALEDDIIQSVEWTDVSANGVISVSKDGTVTPLTQGQAVVKVRVTDIFGNVKEDTTTVLVRIPIVSLEVEEEIVVNVGETKGISMTVTPAEAKDTIEWSIDKSELAQFDRSSLQVTGVQSGTALLTATGYDESGNIIQRQVRVVVKNPVKRITITPSVLELIEGETYLFTKSNITLEPENPDNGAVKWSLQDAAVDGAFVSVSETGLVSALLSTSGRYVPVLVTAQDGSGVYAQVQVLVKPLYIPLESLSFSQTTITIEKGSSLDISRYLLFNPTNATNQTISFWSSNDTRFVTVNGFGVITGIGKGYATVTAVSEDGQHKAAIRITVVEPGSSGATSPDSGGVPILRW